MKTKLISSCLFGIALSVSANAYAGERYNELEDAAVAQAQEWQKGGKARPIMSSDGKVIFAYGQSMPKLTCSPTRACDVEMQAGEKAKKVILGDGVNWTWDSAGSVENGIEVQHVIFQPRDSNLESNVIITTDRRTYHIKLFSPRKEGVYLNRVGFYYPQELVSDWESKAGAVAEVKVNEEEAKVMQGPVAAENLDFDYKVDGQTNFKPTQVFNDGGRVYLLMPNSIRAEESPVLVLLDEKNQAMVVNYRVLSDPVTKKTHYVVDKLFSKGELRLGSEKVTISWSKKTDGFWKKSNLPWGS